MSLLEDLQAVRALVQERWGKGVLMHPVTKRMCLMGCVNMATTGSPLRHDPSLDGLTRKLNVERALRQTLADRQGWDPITTWNDRLSTTKDDVLALVDQAISEAQHE